MYDLEQLARSVLRERGLASEFSSAALHQLQSIHQPAMYEAVDLRSTLFCSIDNDDSRDLDQLTFAEKLNDKFILSVAVADVDALVPKNTPLDLQAQANTTTVYTPAKNFSMLPEKLSCGLTSLNENEDRMACVIKIALTSTFEVEDKSLFFAKVRNFAKLTYNGVGDWLTGNNLPDKLKSLPQVAENLKLQNEIAQGLKERRSKFGALTLETAESFPIVEAGVVKTILTSRENLASQLIENFMIAANHAVAETFAKARIPSLRRVVKVPKNWDRIVEIARDLSYTLPKNPDPKALDNFLNDQRTKNPQDFANLSLSVIKLLGPGEYVVEQPGSSPIGHFGLALREYTHSTAPNRRYPDLITQRQLKALLAHAPNPYTLAELEKLSVHCTRQEDQAQKAERQLKKSAEALFLSSQIGKLFSGIVTGASDKGTWVHLFNPPIDGRIISGFEKLKVHDRVTVRLDSVNIPKGFIDFSHIASG